MSGKRVCCVELKDFHCAIPELCLEKKNRPLRRFATPPLTLGRKVINTLLCRGWGNTSLSSPKLGEVPEGRRGLFLRDSSCLCISIPDTNKCYCEIDAQRYRCYFGVSGKRVCCVELKDFHCAIPELCLEKKNRPLRRFAKSPLTLGRKVINTLLCRSWEEHFSFLLEVRGGARRAEGSVSKG